MNKKQTYITDEEKENCQKVVDAFAELFENEDLTVVNAGKYGFIKLQYYRNHVGFDNAFSFNDSRRLFNDLWQEWLDTQLLDIVGDTPMEETDCGDIPKCLSQEKQQELLDMHKRLAKCPIEESVCNDADYHSLLDEIRTERDYFEGILSEENKERFEKWNMMIFRHEDMTKYARFAQGFRLGAILASEIFSGSEDK